MGRAIEVSPSNKLCRDDKESILMNGLRSEITILFLFYLFILCFFRLFHSSWSVEVDPEQEAGGARRCRHLSRYMSGRHPYIPSALWKPVQNLACGPSSTRPACSSGRDRHAFCIMQSSVKKLQKVRSLHAFLCQLGVMKPREQEQRKEVRF